MVEAVRLGARRRNVWNLAIRNAVRNASPDSALQGHASVARASLAAIQTLRHRKPRSTARRSSHLLKSNVISAVLRRFRFAADVAEFDQPQSNTDFDTRCGNVTGWKKWPA